MALTLLQQKQRKGKLTASMVAPLMTGDEAKLLNNYYLLREDARYVEEDLTWVWPVQLGSVTESLNLKWYEHLTGRKISHHGEVVTLKGANWAACTLDAFDGAVPCPVEAKHVGGLEPLETVIGRYHPQYHWQMIVTGTKQCATIIIEGAREPRIEFIQWNEEYGDELWTRANAFMMCVESGILPVAIPAVKAPIAATISYDMQGNNEWGDNAATWIANKKSAKDFDGAAKAIKAMVPDDAATCMGHGITVSRARNGALTIKEKST